jgi:hypothetical protein
MYRPYLGIYACCFSGNIEFIGSTETARYKNKIDNRATPENIFNCKNSWKFSTLDLLRILKVISV